MKRKYSADESKSQQHEKDKRSIKKQSNLTFKCECGKVYGSLAAVHTHISIKHPDQKKKYKSSIYNPTKTGQSSAGSIRLKDIIFPQKQAEHMCLADNTIKTIYEYVNQTYDRGNEILLNDEEYDSDSELDADDVEEITKRDSRVRNINDQISRLKKQFGLQQLNQIEANFIEFQQFKISKFTLSIVRELTKFCKTPFAAKIQLQIYMTAARKRNISRNLLENIRKCEVGIWEGIERIPEHIQAYYNAWMDIVNRPNSAQ